MSLFTEAGFELVYDKSYPLGTPDLSPVMKGAKESGAKAFVAWSYPPDSFGLAEQAIIEDLDVSVYYSAVATSFPAFGDAYGSKINNVLGAGGTNVDDPKIAEYRDAHLAVTGKVADYWASANTYAALQILEQAIEGAGTLDKETVTQYIKDNSFDTVMGMLTFENNVSQHILVGRPMAGWRVPWRERDRTSTAQLRRARQRRLGVRVVRGGFIPPRIRH